MIDSIVWERGFLGQIWAVGQYIHTPNQRPDGLTPSYQFREMRGIEQVFGR